LSELDVYIKFLLTRVSVYDHAGCTEYCKEFTVALKIIIVIDKKQICNNVITKEYASED